MSIEKSQEPAAPVAPATPEPPKTTITPKFNGKDRVFDIAKAEDAAALKAYAELGMFAEKQNGQISEMKTKLDALEKDPDRAVGRELREWMAADPVGASALTETFKALRERRMDPSQIRHALTAQQSGDATALEAQARASGDPEARAILNQLAADLRNTRSEIEGLRSSQAERDRDSAVKTALASDPIFGSSAAAERHGSARIRELVAGGMPPNLAASQAAQEIRDVANGLATAERDRLAAQEGLRTTRPTEGVPPMAKLAQEARAKIDPKLPPHQQEQQKRDAMKNFLDRVGQRMRGVV